MRARGSQSEQVTQQSPGQQPTFSTNVKVVNVFATVRDKDGQVVRNLTKDDFTLKEDGMPQTIQYFSQQSDLPLTLGLLVDTSGSERRMLGTERDASRTFLEQVLRPEKDKAFLIHFDREVELLQDLTSSRQKLEKALDLIDQPQWGGNRGGGSAGGNGAGNDPNDPEITRADRGKAGITGVGAETDLAAVGEADGAAEEAGRAVKAGMAVVGQHCTTRFIWLPMTCWRSSEGGRRSSC